MKAKGGNIVRARKWGPPRPVRPAKPPAPALAPAGPRSIPCPANSTARSTPRRDMLLQSADRNCRVSRPHSGTETCNQTPPSSTRVNSVLPSARKAIFRDGDDPPCMSKDTSSASSSRVADASGTARARPQAFGSAVPVESATGGAREELFSSNKRYRCQVSPRPAQSPLEAALASARGEGGRLGTPLGSPYPAPGLTWAAGLSASVSSKAAARTAAHLSGGRSDSFAPGSNFFPSFVCAGAAAESAGGGSPVVLEMVRDAAADEEDAALAVAGATEDATEAAAGRVAGWHGLTLYRCVCCITGTDWCQFGDPTRKLRGQGIANRDGVVPYEEHVWLRLFRRKPRLALAPPAALIPEAKRTSLVSLSRRFPPTQQAAGYQSTVVYISARS